MSPLTISRADTVLEGIQNKGLITPSAANSYSPNISGKRNESLGTRKECRNGHPWRAETTYRNNLGYLQCSICRRESVARSQKEHAEWKNEYWRRRGQDGYYRQKSRAFAKKHPEQISAYNAVQRALRKGVLVRPSSCERCHAPCRPEAHHPDHSKWLEVIWLCRPCHLSERGAIARVVLPTDRERAA